MLKLPELFAILYSRANNVGIHEQQTSGEIVCLFYTQHRRSDVVTLVGDDWKSVTPPYKLRTHPCMLNRHMGVATQ